MILCFYRDEDMQSVASLMSMGKTDIGNLEDLEEQVENESQPGDVSFSTRSQISDITAQMNQLDAHFGNHFEDEDAEHDFTNPFGIVAIFMFLLICI